MDDELLKKISKQGNLHPSNKIMDILRKVVCATKEEDAQICDDLPMGLFAYEAAEVIRASK